MQCALRMNKPLVQTISLYNSGLLNKTVKNNVGKSVSAFQLKLAKWKLNKRPWDSSSWLRCIRVGQLQVIEIPTASFYVYSGGKVGVPASEAAGRARKNSAAPSADHLFVKNKIMFWLLFQERRTRYPPPEAAIGDARDKATIKYINNSYRQREYWFARTCFKCFIVKALINGSRCMAIATLRRCITADWQFN